MLFKFQTIEQKQLHTSWISACLSTLACQRPFTQIKKFRPRHNYLINVAYYRVAKNQNLSLSPAKKSRGLVDKPYWIVHSGHC